MSTKHALVASAALGVFAASAIAGGAEAKTTKHHVAHKAGGDAELKHEVEALKAQVQALESRLNSQASVQEQTQAQVQTAQAQAATAQSQAQAAESEIATIPTKVKTEIAAEPHVTQTPGNRLSIQSADGRYSIGLTGRVQIDAGAYVGFHPDSALTGPQELSNGINARRARIGVAGVAGGNFAYSFVYDAGNSQDATPKGIQQAQIVYTGLHGAAFEVGYSDTYFTLDESTTSTDLVFLERATPSNIATSFNAGDFRSNAGARFFGDRYWVGGYLTGPGSGDSHTLTGERFGAFERAAVQVHRRTEHDIDVLLPGLARERRSDAVQEFDIPTRGQRGR